jgi:hypothetical protein
MSADNHNSLLIPEVSRWVFSYEGHQQFKDAAIN